MANWQEMQRKSGVERDPQIPTTQKILSSDYNAGAYGLDTLHTLAVIDIERMEKIVSDLNEINDKMKKKYQISKWKITQFGDNTKQQWLGDKANDFFKGFIGSANNNVWASPEIDSDFTALYWMQPNHRYLVHLTPTIRSYIYFKQIDDVAIWQADDDFRDIYGIKSYLHSSIMAFRNFSFNPIDPDDISPILASFCATDINNRENASKMGGFIYNMTYSLFSNNPSRTEQYALPLFQSTSVGRGQLYAEIATMGQFNISNTTFEGVSIFGEMALED